MTSRTTRVTNLSPYRWVILLMSWAAFTMTSVDRSTWGPASASVGESLAVPLAALGTFATAYYIGYVLSNLGGGVLVDWLGGRLILGISGIGAGLCMFLFGSTTSFAMGLAVQAALGLLAGVDFAAGLKLISTWFPAEKRGFAAGVFMTATSLGTVIANAVVPSVILHSGWGTSYHVFGSITLAIGVGCLLIVRNGTTTPGRRTHRPGVARRPATAAQPQPAAAGTGRIRRTLGHLRLRHLVQHPDGQGQRNQPCQSRHRPGRLRQHRRLHQTRHGLDLRQDRSRTPVADRGHPRGVQRHADPVRQHEHLRRVPAGRPAPGHRRLRLRAPDRGDDTLCSPGSRSPAQPLVQ